MENRINEIYRLARQAAPYNVETKEELLDLLKANGGESFITINDMIFTVDKYGIIQGIGIDSFGNNKIYNNRNFGIFTKE